MRSLYDNVKKRVRPRARGFYAAIAALLLFILSATGC